MKRRDLIFGSASLAALAKLIPGIARAEELVVEQSMDGIRVDNDRDARTLKSLPREILERLRRKVEDFGFGFFHDTAVTKVFYKFEEVTPYVSNAMENQFDVVILVNTAIKGSATDFVAMQNMKIVRRKAAGDLFVRDSAGVITGLTPQAELWKNWPVSTGLADEDGILTFSGIFRINNELTMRDFNEFDIEDPEADMSWPLFIDHIYPDGRTCGVAIHGTPSSEHSILGKKRGSHGCIRLHPKNAKELYKYVAPNKKAFWSNNLMAFDKKAVLQGQPVLSGQGPKRPGHKVLIVFFEGFKKRTVDV